MFDLDAPIFVAGHQGLAGSALLRALQGRGCSHLILPASQDEDLRDPSATEAFFAAERPEYVFLAAGRMAGIQARRNRPAEFLHDNLAIQNNVIHQCWKHGVRRLIFVASACVYPARSAQPMRENHLLTGHLGSSCEPVGIAHIAGIKACEMYNRQYGTHFLTVIAPNLYGLHDQFHPEESHVLPAMIRKLHVAKVRGDDQVTFWGTGRPRREFLCSDDLASACLLLMDKSPHLLFGTSLALYNVGWGCDFTLAELAARTAKVVGFTGTIRWDPTQVDGVAGKRLDVRRMSVLGWQARIGLDEGIALVYADFLGQLGEAPTSPGGEAQETATT